MDMGIAEPGEQESASHVPVARARERRLLIAR
jgi:hypothetical protein